MNLKRTFGILRAHPVRLTSFALTMVAASLFALSAEAQIKSAVDIDGDDPQKPGCVYTYQAAACPPDKAVVREYDVCGGSGKAFLEEQIVVNMVRKNPEAKDIQAAALGKNVCGQKHTFLGYSCAIICKAAGFATSVCKPNQGKCVPLDNANNSAACVCS